MHWVSSLLIKKQVPWDPIPYLLADGHQGGGEGTAIRRGAQEPDDADGLAALEPLRRGKSRWLGQQGRLAAPPFPI